MRHGDDCDWLGGDFAGLMATLYPLPTLITQKKNFKVFTTCKIAALENVSLTRSSLNSDRVNLVAQATPVFRARPTHLRFKYT